MFTSGTHEKAQFYGGGDPAGSQAGQQKKSLAGKDDTACAVCCVVHACTQTNMYLHITQVCAKLFILGKEM